MCVALKRNRSDARVCNCLDGRDEVWWDVEESRAFVNANRGVPCSMNLVVLRCEDIEKSKPIYECLGFSFEKEKHGNGPQHYSSIVQDIVFELYRKGWEDIQLCWFKGWVEVARLTSHSTIIGYKWVCG